MWVLIQLVRLFIRCFCLFYLFRSLALSSAIAANMQNINKFGASLISGVDYQVYISAKHGNGAGHYEINKVTANGINVSLSLDFLVGMFEAGAAVINQRVLFFKTDPGCRIVDVVTRNKLRKNS